MTQLLRGPFRDPHCPLPTMPCELRSERHDATLILTISDPGTHNTVSEQLFAAGIEALDVAESDPAVRCVILQGDAGQFCAGGNIAQLMHHHATDTALQAQLLERASQFIEGLRACPKPVIAAVEGQAAGVGFALVLACDLVVAADDAVFVMSNAALGLSPDGGASWHLAQMLPRPLALQYIWLAEPVAARQLHACGLVNWVANSGQALAEARCVAERLRQFAPNTLASAKELVNQGLGQPLTRQLANERDHFLANLSHPNGSEGLRAIVDKRVPQYR